MTSAAGSAGGRVRIYFEGDATDFERANRQVQSSLARLGVVSGQTSTKGQLFNNVVDQQRRNLSALATGARYAAGGLGILAGVGLAKVARDGIAFNATMESNQLALKNLLGGTKEAEKFLDQLYETAKQTPFEFTDLTSASRRLISFGLDAEKTQRILAATGDAVAAMGGGAENIDRVTLALGQMQAKGRVSAEELLQLTEAGIPAYAILEKELGLTKDQVANIGNEGIKASVAIDALTRGMEKRFGGAAARQAKTWEGLTSTMQDTWAQMTGAITKDLFDELKRWAPTVIRTMDQITRIFERKDLSLSEKLERSLDVGEHNFGPLWMEITEGLDKAEIGNKFIDAVEWAIPRVAENAGELGVEVAEGLAKGFVHADVLGKLFIAGTFIRYVGGWGAIATLGRAIGSRLWPGVFSQMPSTVPTTPGGGPLPGGGGGRPRGTSPIVPVVGGVGTAAAIIVWREEIAKAIADSVPFIDNAGRKALRLGLTRSVGSGFTDDNIFEQAQKAFDGLFGDDAIMPAVKDLARLGSGILDVSSATGQMGHGLRITRSELRGASQASRFFAGNLVDGIDSVEQWERAVRRSSDDVGNALRGAGRVAENVTDGIGKDLDGSGRDHDRFSKSARRDLDRLGDEFKRTGNIVGDVTRGAGRDLDRFDAKSRQMARGVGRNIMGVAGVVTDGLGIIGDNTNEALSAFGVKKVSLSLKKVGKSAAAFQTGGSVFEVPGTGTGDSFPMMVPPDTFILNREAAAAFFPRQTGGMVPIVTEPGELVFSPEAVAQMGGFVEWANDTVSRFQKGGPAGGLDFALGPYDIPPIQYDANHAGANSHWHITGTTTPWVVAIGKQLQRMGFMVGEHPAFGGVNAQHSATGGHYDALAIDVNSAADETRAETAQVARLLSSGEISGAVAERIARLLLKGPDGPMKRLGQAALDKARNAANRFIASKTPNVTGGVSISADGDVERVFARVAKQLSTSKTATLALGEAGYAESGMRDLSYGDSTSQGALQLLASTAASSGINPHDEGAIASSFLTDGYGMGKGANDFAAAGLPAHMVAQSVQRSAFSDGSNYAAQEGAARNWMRRFGLQRGGFAGGRGAGGGKRPPGYNPPPRATEPARPLSFETRLTKLAILLSNAEQTSTIADDQRILERIGKIYARQLEEAQEELEDLGLDKGDRKRALAAADRDIADLKKKLEKDGMTPAEWRRWETARRRAYEREQKEILAGKESKALEKISELTDSLNSNKDQIKSLQEEATVNLVEAVKSLKESIDEQNSLLERESTVQSSELVRALADILSGEIGGRASLAGMNAGYGSVIAA